MSRMQFYQPPAPIAVISFDLDDTLYDNVPVMVHAEQQVQRFMHQQYPQTQQWQLQHWQQLRQQIMRHDVKLAGDMTALRLHTLERGFHELGVSDAKQAAQQTLQQFLRYRSQIDVPAETHEVLQALAQHARLIAISNGNANVEKIGLAPYFDLILQPSAEHRGKPFNDMFVAAQQHYPQLPANAFLHVGDHPLSDIEGARRAGWQSAWYTGGLGRRRHLRGLPTMEFDQLPALLQLKPLLRQP